MKIDKKKTQKFVKLTIYSGSFALISFLAFTMVYYFTTPETKTLTNAISNFTLEVWFKNHFSSGKEILLQISFIGITLIASYIGLSCAIWAKVLHDRAKNTLDSALEEIDV